MLPRLHMTRRGFLRAGAVTFGGFPLASILANETRAEKRVPAEKRSVIVLFQSGGPSQLDMWDMKPDAPVEYRGEFTSIPTKTPGYRVCELMPKLAGLVDKIAILRTVHHNMSDHTEGTHIFVTGYAPLRNIRTPSQQAPSIGSIVSKELGPRGGLPGYIAVGKSFSSGRSAYLGSAHDPFETFGSPQSSNFQVRNLGAPGGIKTERAERRKSMLEQFDTIRRDADASGAIEAMDTYRRQAFDLATDPKVQDAFNLSAEDEKTRELYGRTSGAGQSVLLARRLVERGARFVTVRTDFGAAWDSHQKNFPAHRANLPGYDTVHAALIQDLEERGLLDQTLVISSGEFGRTPKINSNQAGRDHWPTCYTMILAGGGVKRGIILGTSDPRGELPKERPIRYQDVLATMYHQLGIDHTKSYLNEASRPVQIINYGEPINEIL